MKARIVLLPALIAALALGGCASTQQTIQDNPNTGIGAGLGAVGGALIGSGVAGKGRRTEGAAIGAVVGALAGGAVGQRMDEQERALRQQLANNNVNVERRGDNIVLVFPDSITFDTGSSQVKPEFRSALDDVAQSLQQYPNTRIKIAGHTDNVGSSNTNQRLSEDRAYSVRNYLSMRGVSSQRMSAVGYGSNYPVASNNTASGRAQNRRVEITIQPTQ